MSMDFSHALFARLGYDFEPAEEERIRREMRRALEEATGLEIIYLVGPKKAKKLIEISNTDNEDAIMGWINKHFPKYPEVVRDLYDIMLGDLVNGRRNFVGWVPE